ncbi:MAG: NADP-dependent oxidoreductase [Solibacterales bacterium]|nr:NADP-dependent oxidoreductase [Bryobacterales bacterium]|tara:strand:+ start:795 stop:1802 length:1008 start_codon:yes stop_codon:yes gene_type:complete
MKRVNRQVRLVSRPVGLPRESDFELVERPLKSPSNDECLIRGEYLSVDPYMRGRLRDRKSYAPPVQIGDVMVGGVAGRVVTSQHPDFSEGEAVVGNLGWQEYAVANGSQLTKIPTNTRLSTAVGILGMPGITAYFGLLDICSPQPGETVVVSGAAGAVGSVVGQIAKIKGCRSIGIAGTDQKVQHVVEDLGFDAAFNYNTTDSYSRSIRKLCPDGVDCYFDNVGGAITDSIIPLLNTGGRVSVCGQISQYNLEQTEMGPRFLWHLITKQAKIQGFLVFAYADRYQEALSNMTKWIAEGKLHYRETVSRGIENAPRAFIEMLKGGNIGKQIVKLTE